ncbi:unnamed protein product, partial [Soboliphyme baturini]|uniref:IU_nuc_hydro domain-containing protein n=1 Tax=Soboliphyme baturini TaxID=241478 RepID=A0A183IFH5_9BILA
MAMSPIKPVRLVIDCDTAGDDCVSLLIACLHPNIQLEAVTVCAGNVAFDQEIINTLYTLERSGVGAQVPVYAGCRKPLLREWQSASFVHGEDGMGNSNFPLPKGKPASGHAVDALVDIVKKAPGEITILAQAPLTNIALAAFLHPEFVSLIKDLYIMGGTFYCQGNMTPAAEYNFFIDPEAAKMVFSAGFRKIHVFDWGVSNRCCYFSPTELQQVKALGTDLSRFFSDIIRTNLQFNEHHGRSGYVATDSAVTALIAEPGLSRGWTPCHVDIETNSAMNRGACI